MSVYFNTLNQLGFKDCLPQPNGKGRISSFSSISRQLFKSHYDGYHPRTSRQLATALKRYINTRPKYERRSPEFVGEIRRKIICLHEYNQQIAKVKLKYPRSELFDAVLMQYIELECGLLYDTCKEVDEKYENDVTQKVLRLLRVIVYDSLQSSDVSQKSTIEACDKILLKLFASVRDDYISENKLVANTIIKLLQKLNLLDEVNKLKGKNVSFQQDTFLKDPLVSEIRQNLATSDYESDIDGNDDDDLVAMIDDPLGSTPTTMRFFSSVDQKLNLTCSSKNFDHFLTNQRFGVNSFVSSYSSHEIEKEFPNAVDQRKHSYVQNEQSRNFEKISERSQISDYNRNGSSFNKEHQKDTSLAPNNFEPPNIDFSKSDHVSSGNILREDNRRNENNFLLLNETSPQELIKRSPYSKNGENKTSLIDQKRTQLGCEDNQKSLKTSDSLSTKAQNERKSSGVNNFKDSPISKLTKISKDTNSNEEILLVENVEKIEAIEDCREDIVFQKRTNRKACKSEMEQGHVNVSNRTIDSFNVESTVVDLDNLPDSIGNKKPQITNNTNGGIITIEILDDDDDDLGSNFNVDEGSSQSNNPFSNLLQSNEIKQEENEENRSPNFPVRNADNNEPNILNSDKSSRNSSSGEFSAMEKNSTDSANEAESTIVISDSEDDVLISSDNFNNIPIKKNRDPKEEKNYKSSEISRTTTSEVVNEKLKIYPVETENFQAKKTQDWQREQIAPMISEEIGSHAECEVLTSPTCEESTVNKDFEFRTEETALDFDPANSQNIEGDKRVADEITEVGAETEDFSADITCEPASNDIQIPTTESSLNNELQQELPGQSPEDTSVVAANDMSVTEETIRYEIAEVYSCPNFEVQNLELQSVTDQPDSEEVFETGGMCAQEKEIEVCTEPELGQLNTEPVEEIVESEKLEPTSKSVLENEEIRENFEINETRNDDSIEICEMEAQKSIQTDIATTKITEESSNCVREDLEMQKEIIESCPINCNITCSTTVELNFATSIDTPSEASVCNENTVLLLPECANHEIQKPSFMESEIIESNSQEVVVETATNELTDIGYNSGTIENSEITDEQLEDSALRNVENVQETDETVDYTTPLTHSTPQKNKTLYHKEEEENVLHEHNVPLYTTNANEQSALTPETLTTKRESNIILESTLLHTPKHETTPIQESLPLYTVPTITEVQYDEYNSEKKAADLEMLADLAADREKFEVKTDSTKVDMTGSHAKVNVAEITPRRRKSNVKFDHKKKSFPRKVLPRAVKQLQKRHSLKQKTNIEEEEYKRVTRNMSVKSKTDTGIIKETLKQLRVTTNEDSNYKPHDFISIENSALPPRTNNVYAQKRFMEAITTSEDSNDSCESTLFIDLGEKHTEKCKSVFEEETICDMLELITTKEDEVCISIPEVNEESSSDSFHILKQIEDFVDNNNKKSVQEITTHATKTTIPLCEASTTVKTDKSQSIVKTDENQTTIKTDESLNTEKETPTYDDFVSKPSADDMKTPKTTDHSIENILNKTPLNGEKVVTPTLHAETEFQDSTSKKEIIENDKLYSPKRHLGPTENEKEIDQINSNITPKDLETIQLPVVATHPIPIESAVNEEDKASTEKELSQNTAKPMQLVETSENTTQPDNGLKGEESCEKTFKTKAAMKLYEDREEPNQYILHKFKNSVATQELGIRTRLRSKSSEQVKNKKFALDNRSRSSSVDFKISNDSSLENNKNIGLVEISPSTDVNPECIMVKEIKSVSNPSDTHDILSQPIKNENVTCIPIPSIVDSPINDSPLPATLEEPRIEMEIDKPAKISYEMSDTEKDLEEHQEAVANTEEISTSHKKESFSTSSISDIEEVNVPDLKETTKEEESVQEESPLLQNKELYVKDLQLKKKIGKGDSEKIHKPPKALDETKGRSLEKTIKKMKEKIEESEKAKKGKTEETEKMEKTLALEIANISEIIIQTPPKVSEHTDGIQDIAEKKDTGKNVHEVSDLQETKKKSTESTVDQKTCSEEPKEKRTTLVPDEPVTKIAEESHQKSTEPSSDDTKICSGGRDDTKKICNSNTSAEEIKPKSPDVNKDDNKKSSSSRSSSRSPEENKLKSMESINDETKKVRSRSSSISRSLDKKSNSSTDKDKFVHKSSRSRSSSKSRSLSDKKSKHHSDSETDRKRRSASKSSEDKDKIARSQEDPNGHKKRRSKSPVKSLDEKHKKSSSEKSSSKHKTSESKGKSAHNDEKKEHRKRSSKSPSKTKSHEVKEKQLSSEKKKSGEKEKTKTKSDEVQNKCHLTSLENISKTTESVSPKVEHKPKTKSKPENVEAKVDPQVEKSQEDLKDKQAESHRTKSSSSVKTNEKDKHRDGHRTKSKEKRESKPVTEKEKQSDTQKKDDHSKSGDKSRRSHSKEKTRLESSSRSGRKDRSSKEKHKENRTTEHSKENNKSKEKTKEDGKSLVEKHQQKGSGSEKNSSSGVEGNCNVDKKTELIVSDAFCEKKEKLGALPDSEIETHNSEVDVKKKGDVNSESLCSKIPINSEEVDVKKKDVNSENLCSKIRINSEEVDVKKKIDVNCESLGSKIQINSEELDIEKKRHVHSGSLCLKIPINSEEVDFMKKGDVNSASLCLKIPTNNEKVDVKKKGDVNSESVCSKIQINSEEFDVKKTGQVNSESLCLKIPISSEEADVKKTGDVNTESHLLQNPITKNNEVNVGTNSEIVCLNSAEVNTEKTETTNSQPESFDVVNKNQPELGVAEPKLPKQTDDLQLPKVNVSDKKRKLNFDQHENSASDDTSPAKVAKINGENMAKGNDNFVQPAESLTSPDTIFTHTIEEIRADKLMSANYNSPNKVAQVIPETLFTSKEQISSTTQDMSFNRFTTGSEDTLIVEQSSNFETEKTNVLKTQVIEDCKGSIDGKEKVQADGMELCDSGINQPNSTEEDINNKTEITTPVKLLLQNAIDESIPSNQSVYNNTVFSSSQNIGVQVLATLVDSHVKHLPGQEADLSLLPIMSTSISTDCTTSTASLSCTVTSVAGEMVSSCSAASVQEKCLFTYQDSETVNRENLNSSEMFHTQLGLDVISPNKLPLASNQSLDFISPSTSMAEISKPMNLVQPLGTSSINFEVPDSTEIDMQQNNKQNTFCSNFVTRVTGISCYVEKESTADHNYTLGDPLLGGNNEDKNILTTDFLNNSPEEFSSHLEDPSFNETNFFEENGTLEELGLLPMECKKENTTIIDDQIPKPEDLRNSLKHLNMLMENSQTNEPKSITVDNAIDPTSITDSCNYAVSKVLFLRGGQEITQNNAFPAIQDIDNIIESSFPPLHQEKQTENSQSVDDPIVLPPVCSSYSSFMSSENQKVVVEPIEQYSITSVDQIKKDYISEIPKSDEKNKPIVNNKPSSEPIVKSQPTFRTSSFLELVKKDANKTDSQKVKDEMEIYTKRRHHRTPVNPPKKKDVAQQQHTKSPPENKKSEILLFDIKSSNSSTISPELGKGGRIRVKTDLLKVTDSKSNLTDSLSSLEYFNEHDQSVASEVTLPFSKPSPLGHKSDIQEKKALEPILKVESVPTKHARFDKKGNDFIMETILNVHNDVIQKSPRPEVDNSDKLLSKKPDVTDSTKKRKLNDTEIKQDSKKSKKSDDEEKGRKTTDSSQLKKYETNKKPSNDDIFDKLLREGPVNKVFAQRMTEQNTKKENHATTNSEIKNRSSSTISELHKKDRQHPPHSKSVHAHDSRHKDGIYHKNPGYFTSSSNHHSSRKNSEIRHISVSISDGPQKRFIRNCGNSYNSKSEPSTTRDIKSRDRRMSSDQLNNFIPSSGRLQAHQEDDKYSWIDKVSNSGLFGPPPDLFMPPGNTQEDTSSRK